MKHARAIAAIFTIPLVAAALLVSNTTEAQQFQGAIRCNTPLGGTTWTRIEYSYSSKELPYDPACDPSSRVKHGTMPACPAYTDRINQIRRFLGNRWVKKARFLFGETHLETNYDFIQLYSDLQGRYLINETGNSGSWYAYADFPQFLSRDAPRWNFLTDDSVTWEGFSVKYVDLQCEPASVPSLGGSGPQTPSAWAQRQTGVLMGTGDVVSTWYPPNPNTPLSLALWSYTTEIADFDVYVKCGGLPGPTDYTVRGVSTLSQEFIDIGPCSSNIYVSVYSYLGKGQFNFIVSPRSTSQYADPDTTLRAGIEWNATAAELATIKNSLVGASRFTYGTTEGQVFMRNWKIYNNVMPGSGAIPPAKLGSDGCAGKCGGSPCDVCFHRNNDLTESSWVGFVYAPPYVHIARKFMDIPSFNKPTILGHEFGHAWFVGADGPYALPDEYAEKTLPDGRKVLALTCGHSVMSHGNFWPPGGPTTPGQIQTSYNFCYSRDHGYNRQFFDVDSGPTSQWSRLQNTHKLSIIPTSTPDNYSYLEHFFDDYFDTRVTYVP